MASLLQLPSVLVENIYSFLEDEDALHIRLVCRTLRNDVHHGFKHRFFRKRTISMTEESLQNLTKLYSTGLLSLTRIVTLLEDETKSTSPTVWSSIGKYKALIGDIDPVQVAHIKHLNQGLECELKEAARLEDMLVQLLVKLTKPISIRFQIIHRPMMEYHCDHLSESTAAFLRAFATAGSKICAITIRPGSLPLDTFQEVLPKFQQFNQSLSKLETLDISVPCRAEKSKVFISFLSLVPAVKQLWLRFAILSVCATWILIDAL